MDRFNIWNKSIVSFKELSISLIPIYTRVVQIVLSLTQLFDLLYTFPISIGLACTEIKSEIGISFFLCYKKS